MFHKVIKFTIEIVKKHLKDYDAPGRCISMEYINALNKLIEALEAVRKYN